MPVRGADPGPQGDRRDRAGRRAGAAASTARWPGQLADHGHLPPCRWAILASAEQDAASLLLALDARWERAYWLAHRQEQLALDARLPADGGRPAAQRPRADRRVPSDEGRRFSDILLRTFQMSAGGDRDRPADRYPLAHWLSTLSERKANLMMILVLVPFWTSVLVRIASLDRAAAEQRPGQPLPALHRTHRRRCRCCSTAPGVVIAMVHILLPFMILPLCSVMKSMPPTICAPRSRWAARPLAAFFRVYLPQTYRRGRRRPAGLHHQHRLLRDAGPAGRRERPDAELLRGAVHQRRGQLGQWPARWAACC